MQTQPSSPRRFSGAQRWFVAWGVVVALSLLAFYVQLLHESVARGERVRSCFTSTPVAAAAAATPTCRR